MVVIVAALAGVVVLWFFRVRRLMIERQRLVVAILEEFFRPRDKLYTLLGYLVGFKAEYVVGRNGIRRVWLLYTMPPIHVLLYLPVVRAVGGRERLAVTIKPDGSVATEAHLLDPADRVARRSFRVDYGEDALNRCGRRLSGFLACGSPGLIDELEALAERVRGEGVRVTRISVDRGAGVVHAQAVIEGVDPRPLLRELVRLAGRVSA